MSTGTTGILLMAFGGPDAPEAVEPFMRSVMGGRSPAPELVERIKARYAMIGGSSPLPGITAAQAGLLEKHLREEGWRCTVAVGMRHWHPFIGEGLAGLLSAGAEKVIAVSLAPFYSTVSTGAYKEELDRVIASLGPRAPQVTMAEPFFDNPYYLDAVAEKVLAALAGVPGEMRAKTKVIFSAHSLPVSYIRQGDPYVEQFAFTAAGVAARLRLPEWSLAYQSRGGGQGEWLEPTVEEVMTRLRGEGYAGVLVVPVGFVSDHIETLYDIDIAQKKYAASLGLHFHRAAALNTAVLFIRALAETVKRTNRMR